MSESIDIEIRNRRVDELRRIRYMSHPVPKDYPFNVFEQSKHHSTRKRMRVRVYCIREAEAVMMDMLARWYEGVQNDSYRYCREAAVMALRSGRCYICNAGDSILVANSHYPQRRQYMDVSVSKFFEELDKIE